LTRTYFDKVDEQLKISHDSESRIHRIVFHNSEVNGKIPVKSSLFNKLNEVIKISENNPLTYFKNESYTIGLSKLGTIMLFVKSNLKVFPKEFLRSLRQDFNLDDNEIQFLIEKLDFVELEIAHKINDPHGNLKDAKINYTIKGIINKLIAFTDNSHGNIELEFKGDPATSSNLEFLLRDKLNAVLFFAEIPKVLILIDKELKELNSKILSKNSQISNDFSLSKLEFETLEKAFKVIYLSNYNRYKKSGASGLLNVLETIKIILDTMKKRYPQETIMGNFYPESS